MKMDITVYLRKHPHVAYWATVVVVVSCAVLLVGYIYIGSFGRYVHTPSQDIQPSRVGIVFGAGISKDGQPYQQLQARLDTAADALQQGSVRKLLLSGDNRYKHYNEPDAMINYLVKTRHIDPTLLAPDYAGRSTYETCNRAHEVFGVNKAILFTSVSHLPRAIFTCRKFGIESYGISNTIEANNAWRREPLARLKALFNVYVYGERTIKGEQIKL